MNGTSTTMPTTSGRRAEKDIKYIMTTREQMVKDTEGWVNLCDSSYDLGVSSGQETLLGAVLKSLVIMTLLTLASIILNDLGLGGWWLPLANVVISALGTRFCLWLGEKEDERRKQVQAKSLQHLKATIIDKINGERHE